MTPRPIYRWKSFWLGVVVLGFLAWAWGRSMGNTDGFMWWSPGVAVMGGQSAGQVHLAWDGSRPYPAGQMVWIHEPISTVGEPRFPQGWVWERYPRQIQVAVAHWLVMGVFAVAWAGFLGWRWRRGLEIG
ncbi:hypothetical protein OKA05_27375 [Luteolibacter arcticus]|uniref:Uncharacterized protein n=2 Tax=Luteolibacter arcticus TaxID=1581411 RepID=A0ABT3GS48_9BACT|nr:hypothetical protein [Luteolibacter arcticus]